MGYFSYHPSKKSLERRRRRRREFYSNRDRNPFHSFEQEPQYTKKKWCVNHPLSVWNPGFKQCYMGWQKKEPCKEGSLDEE